MASIIFLYMRKKIIYKVIRNIFFKFATKKRKGDVVPFRLFVCYKRYYQIQ